MRKTIKTNIADNVVVVIWPAGLSAGDSTDDGTIVRENIPMGHKVALQDIEVGSPVVRYGTTIGVAKVFIPSGAWVKEQTLEIPVPPPLDRIVYQPQSFSPPEALEGYFFDGYRNADGSVGTKNVLAILISVHCVAGVANYIIDRLKREVLPKYPHVDDIIAINHSYGCGIAIDVPAAAIPIRTLANLAKNPNLGGELMVLGLGCEKLRPERLTTHQALPTILYLQDESLTGFESMVKSAMESAEIHMRRLDQRRRERCPVSDLVVGMQCGGSDALSGITGNPVVGFAADLLVRAGAKVCFSEVTEVRDAVEQLVARCVSGEVADKLIAEMRWYDAYLARGEADRSANTTPGNKAGGLSNIVEKALGSVAKSGSSPIVDVVSPGDRIQARGLNFVATPASDFVCGTLQLAAGMNLHVFVTGRGTPYGLQMAPVIKVSSNSKLANRWHDLIDFDAGPVVSGDKTIEELGWDMFQLMIEVASGREQVATDRLGLYNDIILFNPGPLT